jgi:hypothetical protein
MRPWQPDSALKLDHNEVIGPCPSVGAGVAPDENQFRVSLSSLSPVDARTRQEVRGFLEDRSSGRSATVGEPPSRPIIPAISRFAARQSATQSRRSPLPGEPAAEPPDLRPEHKLGQTPRREVPHVGRGRHRPARGQGSDGSRGHHHSADKSAPALLPKSQRLLAPVE